LRDGVESDEVWRWFSIGCSLAAGRGDRFSDVDCAIGYSSTIEDDDAASIAERLVTSVGESSGVLIHRMEGWPAEVCRLAVEYVDGVQLDLVVMPAGRMPGLRDGELAIVDKDGTSAVPATSQLYGPPDEATAREWTLMAWWWLSDVAKYLHRGDLFEAAERIALVRQQALKLRAAAEQIPYPSFGLTSLLDYEPFALPDGLGDTYPAPGERSSVVNAVRVVADLLSTCSMQAAARLGYDLSTPWRDAALGRLETVR
jgi:hypothetical protein